MTFTKFAGVSPARIPQVIDTLTDADWNDLYPAFLEVVAHEISDWWVPMLGLREDVDAALLFCLLYQRSLSRTEDQP